MQRSQGKGRVGWHRFLVPAQCVMAPCRRVRLVVVTPSASILGDPDIHVKEGSEVRTSTVLYRIVLYCTPYCTGEALYCTVHTVLYTLLYRWSWSASWPTPPSLCPSSPGSLTTRSAQLNLERKEGYVLFDCVQIASFQFSCECNITCHFNVGKMESGF